MRQTVRFQNFVVPGKLRMEIRITIDERNMEYSSLYEGNKTTGITFLPIVSLTIQRPSEIDENGNRVKAKFNINDNLGMSKFNFGIFVKEFEGMVKDMKIPELYTYHGKRLELNEEIAAKIRRPFQIGNTVVELSAVVIEREDETRIEGCKMKFNNEQSSILLTLNEMDTLLFNLDHIDIDSVALLMYLNYITKPNKPTEYTSETLDIDIKPKEI